MSDFFGQSRIIGESDKDYAERAIDTLLKYPRTSEPAILDGLKRFGDIEILTGLLASMVLDRSFCDNFQFAEITNATNQIFAAILGDSKFVGLAFHFILILKGIDPANIQNIINFLNTAKGGGIGYTIYIQD